MISWNVHEGAADIVRLASSFRPAEVVVLVQEAMRASDDVPELVPRDVDVPRRQAPERAPPTDIVEVADALNFWLTYVPSMRNGREREDRGCAILSSMPLSEAAAIELPWVRQRRVAVMATATSAAGKAIQVVAAHLENRPGRRRQAAALAQWLAERARRDLPLVVGADLNAWFGAGEDTVRQIDRVVPLVRACEERPTFRFGLRLDYVFARADVSDCQIAASAYGSDHRPIVLVLRGW